MAVYVFFVAFLCEVGGYFADTYHSEYRCECGCDETVQL